MSLAHAHSDIDSSVQLQYYFCISFFNSSGVTIGVGVDLKETTRQYFRSIGVSEAVIDKLAPYFGLQVFVFVRNHKHDYTIVYASKHVPVRSQL